ncbi:MAG: TIGR00730 family Rossman fold protein [Bacteroidales bacterium]|nr:TIGR00730 family Rossman fold protein [Bacteroidales bacterium]
MKIGVFCGSQMGRNPRFAKVSAEMGCLIARRGDTFVYGGSNWGYMGVSSGAALQEGGRVVGVIPSIFHEDVIQSQPVTELVVVSSMAERKQRIAEMSDAFIALPGGVGTLDEVTEMLTNNQLGFGCKPVGLLNVDGFYDCFLQQLRLMLDEGLLRQSNFATVLSSATPDDLLCAIDAFVPPDDSAWLQKVRS